MSKRQLFIIIAILVVLDIAAGFWYLAGHINADGNGAVLFDSSDEAVEAADTVAGNSKPDHFETMAAHAYYVSRQPVEEEDASTYLSCIKRFKGRIPVSVNGNKALGEPPACSGAPAIRNAVLQATGVSIDRAPLTPHVLFERFKEEGLI